MTEDTPARTAKQKFIAETWGESFVPLADNPRIAFEDAAIIVSLWKPIPINGETSATLSLAEPTLDQLRVLDRIQGDAAQTQRLLMQCAKLTEKEAGAIGVRDLTTFGALMQAFTGPARATGA